MGLSTESRGILVSLWWVAKESGEDGIARAIQEALELLETETDPSSKDGRHGS